jgi:hypothetical protein
VPAFYQGPEDMKIAHVMYRPGIRVTFGTPIPTAELTFARETTITLTRQLEFAVANLRSTADVDLSAAQRA